MNQFVSSDPYNHKDQSKSSEQKPVRHLRKHGHSEALTDYHAKAMESYVTLGDNKAGHTICPSHGNCLNNNNIRRWLGDVPGQRWQELEVLSLRLIIAANIRFGSSGVSRYFTLGKLGRSHTNIR